MRKVEIVVGFGRGPDLAGFEASVIGGRVLDEIGLAPILEVELQVLQNAGLVAFDGEMVMRLALPDQRAGQLALGQQGIGTDILSLQSRRLLHRDRVVQNKS